jgi:transcriptional antiterminator Rof (Rho-off)
MRRISLACLFILLVSLSTGAVISATAGADVTTFKKSRVIDAEGKEQKATLVLGENTATVHRKDHPEEVYSTFDYDNVTAMYYERAKSARIKTALLVSPVALFSKGKKHWLTVEYKRADGKGDAVILRLDKKEYRAILGELSSRCPVELQREETK